MGSIVNPNNYPAKNNVMFIILLSLVWIVIGTFIPDKYLFYSIEGFLIILIIVSVYYKNPLDIIILTFIASVMAVSFYFIYPNEEYQQFVIFRTAAITAFGMMAFVLSIGPLSRISSKFLKLYKYRRHLGVSVFFLGALHATQAISFHDLDIQNLIGEGDFAALGVLTLLGLGFLALTSWDYIQKRIHPIFFDCIHLLWFLGIIFIIYLDYQEYGTWRDIEPYSKQWLYPVLIVFSIVTFRFSLPKLLLKSIMPWKQLHVLSWIIFLTMGLHAVTAYDTMVGSEEIVRPVWMIIILVFLIHAGVWINDTIKNRKVKRILEKEIDGKMYARVGKLDDFVDQKGQRFDIGGTSIAVFKIDDQVYAYSNVCAHQKGPICESSIEDGYLICPWHRFQYGIKDGKGPVGFNDEIPFYQTHVENGNVWISLN